LCAVQVGGPTASSNGLIDDPSCTSTSFYSDESSCLSKSGSVNPAICIRNMDLTCQSIEPFSMKCHEASLESGGKILSVTLRSLYALVSQLCLTGLSDIAMPYSGMWQDCQSTLQHTRPCYAKSSYRLVDPRPFMETSTRSTTSYQMPR